jgi:hypothetical protein
MRGDSARMFCGVPTASRLEVYWWRYVTCPACMSRVLGRPVGQGDKIHIDEFRAVDPARSA